jgi:hypothetical protein
VRKTSGRIDTLVRDISHALGFVDADGVVEFEPSTALRMTGDGSVFYVANFFGLYRLSPQPLQVTGDIDGPFELFDDGAILAVPAPVDDGSQGTVRVYKVDPNAAASGTVRLSELTPWATMTVPNNGGRTLVNSASVDPAGNVFVSLFTTGGIGIVPLSLRIQGTSRFVPSGTAGVAAGFVNLRVVEHLTF